MVGEITADQLADEPGEEDNKRRPAELLDVESMNLEQVIGHPGEQAVPHRVEEHPAEAHRPHRPIAKEIHHITAGRFGRLGIFQGVRFLEIARLRLVDARMVSRVIANIEPAPDASQYGADAGDDERQSPRV